MIVGSRELRSIRSDHRNETIALRLGCYDVLHFGHQNGINVASSVADILVVGIMPDEYVRREKGHDRPINPAEKRILAIDNAEGVDYSFIAGAGRIALARTLMALRPNAYVEGSEHAGGRAKVMFLGALGIDYIIDNQKHGSSSAMISSYGPIEASRLSSLDFRSPVLSEPEAPLV